MEKGGSSENYFFKSHETALMANTTLNNKYIVQINMFHILYHVLSKLGLYNYIVYMLQLK